MIDYAKLAILGTLSAILFGSGWWMGYSRYLEYKKSVEIAAKEQEAHVESIKKQQELVTKGIEKEYEARLNLLRQYYANGVRQSNSSTVSSISNTANGLDAFSANKLLTQCAETTQQLVSLQQWINDQLGLK